MNVIDLTFDDDDDGREAGSAALLQMAQSTPRRGTDEVYELSDGTPTAPVQFKLSSQPPARKRKRLGTQESALTDTTLECPEDTPAAVSRAQLVIEVGDSPVIDSSEPVEVDTDQLDTDYGASPLVRRRQYAPTQAIVPSSMARGAAAQQHAGYGSYQAHAGPSSYQQHAGPGSYQAHVGPSSYQAHGRRFADTDTYPTAHLAAPYSDLPLQAGAGPEAGARGAPSMRMIGQLRAVAVVSTGSVHYREGRATQIPTTLRNRRGAAQEVELYDQTGGLIGMLEQSVTKTIFSLQACGHIKVAGITAGPLRGKFISPILLSFYANRQLALGIMRILEESGLFLDQSTAESQHTMHALGSAGNVLTQDRGRSEIHPSRDPNGLMSDRSNSDNVLPSVFADMEFTSTMYNEDEQGAEWVARAKERYRQMPLPGAMRVVTRPQEPADAKTRLASIKSTFVTLLDLPETDAPALITTPLRRHQKQALYFMMHRETDGVDVETADAEESVFPKLWMMSGERGGDAARQEYSHALVNVHCIGPPAPLRGGVLADDMGLGKTLTTIALIASLPPTRCPAERVKFGDSARSSPGDVQDTNDTRDSKGSGGFGCRKRNSSGSDSSRGRRNSSGSGRGKHGGNGSGRTRKARIARNPPPARSRRRAADSQSDSDSFTELLPAKRVCRTRSASQAPRNPPLSASSLDSESSALSDSDYLTDDPLDYAARRSRPRSRVVRADLASNSESESSDTEDSFSDGNAGGYESDGRPMTPPPEFDNLPTKNKVACERRFGESYRGRYAGNTLIVCPLSTMSNWEEQVATHVRARGMSVYAYHGNTRTRSARRLCHYDVVLTTFNVLQSEYARETRQLLLAETAHVAAGVLDSSSEEESSTRTFQVPADPYVSPLQAVHWHRVVLDEAHNIKERRTISSLAAHALTADRRWCLTGTPIQNRLDDLYSQLRFLHATPLDNWKIWLTYIAAPFHANARELAPDGQFEEGNIGANRVQRLMQTICLRRMKQQLDMRTNRTMIELPPKFECVRWLELAPGERRLYQMAEDIARSKFASMAQSGTVLKNYMNILKIILRLRQLCTHPRLWSADKWSEARKLAEGKGSSDEESAKGTGAEAARKSSANGGRAGNSQAESKPARSDDSLADNNKLVVIGDTPIGSKPVVIDDTPIDSKPVVIDDNADDSPVDYSIKTQSDAKPNNPFYAKWDEAVRMQGPQVKCEFCGGSAIPAALLQAGSSFGAADYPGPAITKCRHLVCHQCQVVLCGAAPANAREEAALCNDAAPLTECIMCGELLGPADAVRLSAQRIKQSLGGTAHEAAEAEQEQDPYSELDRMCSEQATSTKITTLLADIDKIRRRAWFTDAGFGVDQAHPAVAARRAELLAAPRTREKCVVFSQWTSMLNLIEPLLAEQGICFTRLDGAMTRPQRESNLRRFKQDADVEILLLSLRAGGVGLNLAHASHVFLMDAFWNPSVENQAIDRIHRLGQKHPITVTRYFIKNSIEEKIMTLQQRKAKIVDISLMDSTRTSHAGSPAAAAQPADSEDALAITAGTRSRQQRLDELNLLLG